MLGYVQCDTEVPDPLRNFLQNFLNNTLVDLKYIGKLMKRCAEEDLTFQPQKNANLELRVTK